LGLIRAVTRELPNNYPYIVKKHFIGSIVKEWNSSSKKLFDSTKKELTRRVKEVIEDHFSQYTQGHLKQRIMYVSMPLSHTLTSLIDVF
jgi:hypothetical protein